MFRNNVNSDKLISKDIQDMLAVHLGKPVEFDLNLSPTQQQAFDLFKGGKNILLLGSGGTGKSKVIKTMEEYNKMETSKTMYLTSTTGISSYNIGGVTVHSLLGIGTGELEVEALIRKVARKQVYRDRIINIDILVIDEASMLSADLFEKLNTLCQHIRRSNSFFGGIQVILSMDPLQLTPVFNRNTELYKVIDDRLIVESPVFNKTFKPANTVILKENFRQKNDPSFINLLSRIRDGTFTTSDVQMLNQRKVSPSIVSDHVHLVSTNKKAQIINDTALNKLNTKSVNFTSTFSTTGANKEIKELLTKELQYQFKQKGITELALKKGCRVMLIKNLDIPMGLVNGALGTVTDFVQDSNSNWVPMVHFDGELGIQKTIEAVSWELEIDNCKGNALQIPLMLAYSLTISKSQSLTLDSAVLDLDDVFCDAMCYVALSRLRSLETMYLKSFNPKKIMINKVMKDFLDRIDT